MEEAFVTNPLDSLDPNYERFEPLGQPKNFPGSLRAGVENYMRLPHELRNHLMYVPCFVKARDENIECEKGNLGTYIYLNSMK